MKTVIITGSSGLIGSEAAKFFHSKGMKILGIDNNMREYYFGEDGSTLWNLSRMKKSLENLTHENEDIRNQEKIEQIFEKHGDDVALVIHTAAQPSHDWAVKEPHVDFTVNANGTLTLLEATRKFCPKATFIFTSTNKVYGDTPNKLPLIEESKRWEIDPSHEFFEFGIDESMSIDSSKHSIFGASKVAADIMVQEYGRYFGMKTVCFRGGCLTGPAHSGAQLHGFLSYLVKCAITGRPYTIFGYKGKQVRDNIHATDLVSAFWEFYQNPRVAEIYNIGGARKSNCSILEAIDLIEEISGKKLEYTISDDNRSGDHLWWVSDTRKFEEHYPNWSHQYDVKMILSEIIKETVKRESQSSKRAGTTDNRGLTL